MMLQSVRAFLYVIRSCENTFPDVGGISYRTFYGGSLFTNMADHPVNTGEKKGIPLPAQVCRNAGIASGVCVSTAAGAYQFTVGTWNSLRKSRGVDPALSDFTGASQDIAAIRLLMDIGAYRKIALGDFAGAIAIAGARWASLPGATGHQGQKPMSYVEARYTEGLALPSV